MSHNMGLMIAATVSIGAMLHADETPPTTRPAAEPAAFRMAADPNYIAGREWAKKDLAAGNVGQMLAIPESFFLQWNRGSPDENLFPYYQAIVAERYQIAADYRIFIPGRNDDQLYVMGYNQAMQAELDKRCGKEKLDEAWIEACHTPTEKRQAHLQARETRGSSTTQPTTRGS